MTLTRGWPENMPKGYYARKFDLRDMLQAIVFAVYYDDLGDPGIEWTRCAIRWEHYWKPALEQEHSGDCTNDAHSCHRCQAEEVVRIARIIEEGLADGLL